MIRPSSLAYAVLMLGGCVGGPGLDGNAGRALARDVAAYATASCFAALDDPFLRDQGQLWAGGVVQRGEGPIEALIPLADAVRAELERSGVGQGKPDGSHAPSKPMPVMTCGEIVHAPAVAAGMARAETALRSAYRARRRD
jgi:hypothetical protein